MNGDYTKVPLRADERWTGARMQQGRVLLDHDWNLNLDAAARDLELAALDAIGAGVPWDSDGFKVTVPTTGAPDLLIEAGRIWVGGLLALAPAPFKYSEQSGAPGLPSDKAIVYLDVFEEHVQPAEAPAELIEPALAPVQSAARTRVGYRVRAEATTATTARAAWAALRDTLSNGSSGALTIAKPAPTSSSDPCAPPGDPGSEVPEGLFRVEALDGGSESSARFAWAFDNGATVAQVLAVPTSASDVLIESPPGTTFAKDDLVELSWLERRADRQPHGELYKIDGLTPKTQGVSLQLSRTVGAFAAPPAGARGLVVRRWDGQATGPGTPYAAKYKTRDVALITPGAGAYEAGDWWGARLRDGSSGLEERTKAAPDGTAHSFLPLAFVHLQARTAVDMRPKFRPLVEQDSGTCTVTLNPDSDLQREFDKLPAGGAEVCFQAGTYLLDEPLRLTGKRLTLHGAGPATVLAATSAESALVFDECTEVEVRGMRIQGGPASSTNLDGALTFLACVGVRVSNCTVACADAAATGHTCLTVRGAPGAALAPDAVTIEQNTFEIGTQQIGVLLVDVDHLRVAGNRLMLSLGNRGNAPAYARQGIVVGGTRGSVVQIDDNQLANVAQGIHVGLSDTSNATLRAGRVHVRGNAVDVTVPIDYAQDRHAIFVGAADSIQVLENSAWIQRIAGQGARTPVNGVVIKAPQGPMMVVRDTSLDGFEVGVAVTDVTKAKTPADGNRVWLVEGTMAANGKLALDAPLAVDEEHNAPMPVSGKLTAGSVVVTPAAAGTGTTAQGKVTLDAPAGRAGVTIALSSDNSAVASVSPQTVTIAPGTDSGGFTVTTTSQALTNDQVVKIQADLSGNKAGFSFTVIGKAAVQALGLAPSDLVGGGGAKSQGTVSITKADPAAIIALSSSNPAVANPPATVQVPPNATSATFDVQTFPVTTDQIVAITAGFNNTNRNAALSVRAEPLLKVRRIRIFHAPSDTGQPTADDVWFDTMQAGAGFFPSRSIVLRVNLVADLPNAIEIEFVGGPLNTGSVQAGVNFLVAHPGGNLAQPVSQRIRTINASTVRWIANPLPASLPQPGVVSATTTYTVQLLGDGAQPITSQRGRRLDGELVDHFPGGNGLEGGNAEFFVKLMRVRDEVNSHVGRGQGETP